MDFPKNLLYTKDHEWIRKETDGTAVVGITEFAASELGDIVYVDIETVGEKIVSGEVFGSVEAVKTVSDLFIPISCEVLEINPELDSFPDLVNKEPYGGGWLIKVKPADDADFASLLSADAYKALVG